MKSSHFKALPTFTSSNLTVDREKGILYGVSVANLGDNLNGSYFDNVFLEALQQQGNDNPNGIKSRFGHPTMCGNAFGTFIGRQKNFTIGENGNLYADLHLDPITKKTQVEGKGISMFEYIMDMAETNSDVFGNSIHVYSETHEKPVNGKVKTLHLLEKFKAVDVVDDPAATDGMFNIDGDLGVTLTNFLDENPQIFEVVAKDNKIIENFFSRYENYSQRKSINNSNMNKFFQNLFKGKKFDIDMTLANGSIVTVKTEAEEPAVGDPVVDADGGAVPDDTHMLKDGTSIVTVGGKITEIVEATEPPAPPTEGEPTMAEVMASVNKLAKSFDTFQKNQVKVQGDNEKAFEKVVKMHDTFEKKVNSFITSIDPDSDDDNDLPRYKGGKSKVYDADKAKEIREKGNK